MFKIMDKSDKQTLMADPPKGWRYGFPAPKEENYEQQLLDAGYNEEDIPFLVKHSRFWYSDQ